MKNNIPSSLASQNAVLAHWKYPTDLSEIFLSNNDPRTEEIWRYRTEQYFREKLPCHINLYSLLRRIFYIVKPCLPRKHQIILRQKLASKINYHNAPQWPVDPYVERTIYEATLKVTSENPGIVFPMISFWPGDFTSALVITHDVEQHQGYKNIEQLMKIEQQNGFHSAWYFVPGRYQVDHEMIQQLQGEGFEVGIHGLKHDGKLFQTKQIFKKRARSINKYLNVWQEGGFRSPSLIRNLDWISEYLHIEYDTSVPNSEWYGAQPGGCRTVFPFIYKNIVELPVTLQQDHTLLEILNLTPEQVVRQWVETIQIIKEYHGLILIIVHPDCLNTPDRQAAYIDFLQYLKSEKETWRALPKEAARWWRNRQDSELISTGSGWRINGPAADRGVVQHVVNHDNKIRLEPYAMPDIPPDSIKTDQIYANHHP